MELKLIIKKDGSFVYKQIGPIERKREKGTLIKDSLTGEFKVETGNRSYKVLKASVTYFHGNDRDEAIVLIPQDGESIWAAVENIIIGSGLNNYSSNNIENDIDSSDISNDIDELSL